jgi:transposase
MTRSRPTSASILSPRSRHSAKRIEELTGIKRSPTQVGIFLKKLGLKRLKTSAIPAKCNVQLQASFKKTN